MKKALIIGMMVVCWSIVSTNVFAVDIREATIHKIGDYNGTAVVFVSGAPLTGTTAFYLTPANKKDHLAILLTARAVNATVWMRTAGDTPGSLVTVVYINE